MKSRSSTLTNADAERSSVSECANGRKKTCGSTNRPTTKTSLLQGADIMEQLMSGDVITSTKLVSGGERLYVPKTNNA